MLYLSEYKPAKTRELFSCLPFDSKSFSLMTGETKRVRKGGRESTSISSVLRRLGHEQHQQQKWRITPYCYCILFA